MIHPPAVNALFLIGLPDNKELIAHGYNDNGKLVYMWDGNSDFHAQITHKNISSHTINLLWFKHINYQIPTKPDIIVNCINDADICSKSLGTAQELIDSISDKVPDLKVFNPPKKVIQTTRDRIYQDYHHLDGLYIPKTVRITPTCPDDVITQLKEHGLDLPFLIRPCGSHQSQGLQLIDQKDTITRLERYAYDGTSYYVSEYVDYGINGRYQKARLVMMHDRIIARHFMTGQNWMVHGDLHESYMASREQCKKDEMYFLHNYKKMISKEALASLRTIYKKSGLDYLGFDFAIREDKSLLIFEINPTQNVFLKLNNEDFPYMQKVSADMVDLLNKAIYSKARS